KITGEGSFQLRSAGPDMVIGTGDDLLLSSDGSNESGEGVTYGTHEAFGTLAPGDELEGLDFTEHGLIAAYRVKRGNQCLVIANGVEHSLFD
ncbi:MAG: hypothetical protein P1V35_13755, partial [Planctomycetota bacterium]|nr:hypothetical protein [Planctomycetota bacterium]